GAGAAGDLGGVERDDRRVERADAARRDVAVDDARAAHRLQGEGAADPPDLGLEDFHRYRSVSRLRQRLHRALPGFSRPNLSHHSPRRLPIPPQPASAEKPPASAARRSPSEGGSARPSAASLSSTATTSARPRAS